MEKGTETSRRRSTKQNIVKSQEAKMIDLVAEATKATWERRRNITEEGWAGRRPRANKREAAQKAAEERQNVAIRNA